MDWRRVAALWRSAGMFRWLSSSVGWLVRKNQFLSAPGDISGELACRHSLCEPPGEDVLNANPTIFMKGGGDDADGRLETMRSGLDASEVSQRGDDADESVAAHAKGADVVEEEDARSTR